MSDDFRIVLDQAAIASLGSGPEVQRVLMGLGQQVASAAASDAPHRSGAGAASIHPQAAGDEVDVGWDSAHHYMFFHEVGTRFMSARPFLSPALDYAHL